MKAELRKYLLELQQMTEDLTEKMKKPCRDFKYWDGRNDTLLEVLTKLEKILKIG